MTPQWGDVCKNCESTGNLCIRCCYCEACNHDRNIGCDHPFRITKDGITSRILAKAEP